jgi:prepilin-type N-terminal cleavage/methylation domain-containing protein
MPGTVFGTVVDGRVVWVPKQLWEFFGMEKCMMAQKRQHSGNHGFTLLELILVMVILSTVLAMAAPSLRGFFGSRKTHDEAAQLLALTQFARSQAISEGIIYRLNFDTNERTYWLTSQQAGVFKELETEFGHVFTFPNDITVELEEVEKDNDKMFFAFTPQGTVTAGTIRLIDRRGLVLEITCPTVTELFSIVEREQVNGRYISKQNS